MITVVSRIPNLASLFFFCCECDWSGVVIGWRGTNEGEAVEPELR